MLTEQQDAFAAGLAKGMTQAAAYREAFPRSKAWKDSTVHTRAYELAQDREIRVRVQELQSKAAAATEASVERLVQELVCLTHFDPAEIAKVTLRGPKDIAKLPEHVRRAIVGWSWDAKGRFTLKLSSKTPAAELLGRVLGAFKDTLNLNLNQMTDEELEQRVAALVEKAGGGQ